MSNYFIGQPVVYTVRGKSFPATVTADTGDSKVGVTLSRDGETVRMFVWRKQLTAAS